MFMSRVSFVFIVLAILASCTSTDSVDDIIEIAKYEKSKMKNSLFYNQGDPTKTVILEKTDDYIFILNKTVPANMQYFGYENIQKIRAGVFDRTAREHCNEVGKNLEFPGDIQDYMVSGYVEQVSEHSVVMYCISSEVQKWNLHENLCIKTDHPGVCAQAKEGEAKYKKPEKKSYDYFINLLEKYVEISNSDETAQPDTVQPPASRAIRTTGTGFFVSGDGHLITNNHVIEGCSRISVRFGPSSIEASIISLDPYNDLALLKVENFNTSYLLFKKTPDQVMDEIYVAGYPYGDLVSSSLKTTKGIISALSGYNNNFSQMQIDAAIQPGNSGGPVFNEDGRVAAVAVAALNKKLMLSELDSIPENINFGIKASIAINFILANGISQKDIVYESVPLAVSRSTVMILCG